MKERIIRVIIYVLLIIICSFLGILGYLNRPSELPDSQILNIDYYKYNTMSGNYDEIKLSENELYYNGETLELKNCKNYTYTEVTGIVKLDCRKAFRIVGFTEDALVINMNRENQYFYKDKEKSFSGEFQRKYQMSLDAYRIEGEKLISEIEIDIDDFLDLIKRNETSYVYIKGSNCKNECTLFNKEFQNFSDKNNIYYLNSSKLTQEDMNALADTYKDLPDNITLSYLNGQTPLVFVIENRKIKEIIKIEGQGFDYSKYNNYANTLEVENE